MILGSLMAKRVGVLRHELELYVELKCGIEILMNNEWLSKGLDDYRLN